MNKILILLTLSLFCINANADSIYDAKKISAATIDQWKKEVKESFDKAEKEVYKNVNPDNTPVGPNEDPKKCACKGYWQNSSRGWAYQPVTLSLETK